MKFTRYCCGLSLSVHMLAALACPLCDTKTGLQVRAGIFNSDFLPTLLAVLSPFIIFAAIGLFLYYGWPFNRGKNN